MNRRIALYLIILITVTLPLTLFVITRPQVNRGLANTSSTLFFKPSSTANNPIKKKPGSYVPLDVILNPGSHKINFVKLQIKFNPSILVPDTTAVFVRNQNSFPVIVEGPIVSGDTLTVSLSTGNDPTRTVNSEAEVGTLIYVASSSANNQNTVVSFTSSSQTISSESANQNTLSTTIPAYFLVESSSTPSVTPSPTRNPSATLTPAPTSTTTVLLLDLQLHGIGESGDNPNPRGAELSNKKPLHPQRNISIEIIDSNNRKIKEDVSFVVYNAGKGNFSGKIDLGSSFPEGYYTIKMKTNKYLKKQIDGIVMIENKNEIRVPQTAFTAGDTKNDNALNIMDYNILRDCGFGAINPLPMADPNSIYNSKHCKAHNQYRSDTDLDDNGVVDSADYNLFLREISVQSGE